MSTQSKVIFANQLRGVAALFVVFAHLGYVFWMVRETVANFIGANVMEGPNPPGIGVFVSDQLNLGVLGVAIFFLISGFVIPFSLRKVGQVQFLVARVFRIYPTYILGLLVGLLAVWLSSRYWGKPFMWDFKTILQNMALIHSLTGAPSVDLVNWTLAIELKFYIVMCLMAAFANRAVVWPFIAFSFLVLVLNKLQNTAIGTELMLVGFMFVGVLFNYRLREKIGVAKFIGSVAVLLIIFFVGWDSTPWAANFKVVAPNYAYGVAVFGLAFMLRHKFKESKLLDFFADISYPLYITHSLVGYSVMRFMFDEGVRYRYIVPITAAIVIFTAYALHKFVEIPSVKAGRGFNPLRRFQSA